jgi:uncharacterized iron-regulated membrane protein
MGAIKPLHLLCCLLVVAVAVGAAIWAARRPKKDG